MHNDEIGSCTSENIIIIYKRDKYVYRMDVQFYASFQTYECILCCDGVLNIFINILCGKCFYLIPIFSSRPIIIFNK